MGSDIYQSNQIKKEENNYILKQYNPFNPDYNHKN
jgi:hypothetical protein